MWRRSALQVILNGKVIFSNNDRENDNNNNNQTGGLNQFKVVSFLAKFKVFSSFFQKHSKLTPFKKEHQQQCRVKKLAAKGGEMLSPLRPSDKQNEQQMREK